MGDYTQMKKINFNILKVKNPDATVSPGSIINPDVTINPGAAASPGSIINPDVTINPGAAASVGAITNPDATINNIFLLEKVENSIVDPPTNFFKYFLVLLFKCSLQSSFTATNFLKG